MHAFKHIYYIQGKVKYIIYISPMQKPRMIVMNLLQVLLIQSFQYIPETTHFPFTKCMAL